MRLCRCVRQSILACGFGRGVSNLLVMFIALNCALLLHAAYFLGLLHGAKSLDLELRPQGFGAFPCRHKVSVSFFWFWKISRWCVSVCFKK